VNEARIKNGLVNAVSRYYGASLSSAFTSSSGSLLVAGSTTTPRRSNNNNNNNSIHTNRKREDKSKIIDNDSFLSIGGNAVDKSELDTAELHTSVGSYFSLIEGNHGKALDSHKQALRIYQRVYGKDSDSARVADSLNAIGLCLSNTGDYGTSNDCLSRALEMRERLANNADTLQIAVTLASIGHNFHQMSNYEQAVRHDHF
jgi:tetratricopeptide (TPR) repeat protein